MICLFSEFSLTAVGQGHTSNPNLNLTHFKDSVRTHWHTCSGLVLPSWLFKLDSPKWAVPWPLPHVPQSMPGPNWKPCSDGTCKSGHQSLPDHGHAHSLSCMVFFPDLDQRKSSHFFSLRCLLGRQPSATRAALTTLGKPSQTAQLGPQGTHAPRSQYQQCLRLPESGDRG